VSAKSAFSPSLFRPLSSFSLSFPMSGRTGKRNWRSNGGWCALSLPCPTLLFPFPFPLSLLVEHDEPVGGGTAAAKALCSFYLLPSSERVSLFPSSLPRGVKWNGFRPRQEPQRLYFSPLSLFFPAPFPLFLGVCQHGERACWPSCFLFLLFLTTSPLFFPL